jgi:hypothetical protein
MNSSFQTTLTLDKPILEDFNPAELNRFNGPHKTTAQSEGYS